MSEAPERIEREMSEIRSRMSTEINDLRKHFESQVVVEQVKQTTRQRLSEAADRGKANLKAKQQDLAYSAKRSLSQARRKISNRRGE
jgi:hypothetical protein